MRPSSRSKKEDILPSAAAAAANGLKSQYATLNAVIYGARFCMYRHRSHRATIGWVYCTLATMPSAYITSPLTQHPDAHTPWPGVTDTICNVITIPIYLNYTFYIKTLYS